MPIVTISLREGRTVEQKRELARRVTQAICESLNAKPASVRIIINDMKKENFAVAGTLDLDNPDIK